MFSPPLLRHLLICSFCLANLVHSPAASAQTAADDAKVALFRTIQWQDGPCTVSIPGVANLTVPEGYRFSGHAGALVWNELTGNPPDDKMSGVLLPHNLDWSLQFSFDAIGYVPDDERTTLDADAILLALQAGTAKNNEYRRSRGVPELSIVGWIESPHYDQSTHNLVWAMAVESTDWKGVNYDTRILGRRGVMQVKLVATREQMPVLIPTVKGLLSGFRFEVEQSYGAVRAGDKVAKYGLTTLITGGVTAVAAKSGFLQKFGKLIALGLAALSGAIYKLLGSRKAAKPESP